MKNFIKKEYKNKEIDLSLIKKVKENNDSEAFLTLCEMYERIFFTICHKYTFALQKVGISVQDILDEKNVLIFDCIKKFDVTKNTKFGSYLGNYSRFLILNSIHARKFISSSSNEEVNKFIENSQVVSDYSHNTHSKTEDYKYLCNLLNQMKDERIKRVFTYRHLMDKRMTWNQVSKKMGISCQTAINVYNSGLKLLKNKINSKFISDKV